MATAFAELPIGRRTIDAPTVNKEQATLQTTRVLFFAHDTITDREKRELPFKEFGGIHLPHIATLRDSRYMLYRCCLTQLPPFKMIGDWEMMLPPEERKHWKKSFIQTVIDENGQEKNVTVSGFLESNVTEEGEFKQKRSSHLVFTERYPLHEARQAIRRTGSHTPGGVVDIEALLNATRAEIDEAQYFFFPEWDEIIKGAAQLPSTTRGLQDHLKARVEAIKDQPWDSDKKAKFYAIGKDMLRSSTEYHRTALEATRQDEIVSKSAFTKGDTGATTSVISEQYLEQTGTRRKEDLVTGEASAVSELTREMRAERQSKAETDAKALLLEERKQYVAEVTGGFRERDTDEEIRLGMIPAKSPEVNTVDVSEPPVDPHKEDAPTFATQEEERAYYSTLQPVEGDPSGFRLPVPMTSELLDNGNIVTGGIRYCGQKTATNGVCQRELKPDEQYCFQHPPKETTEG